jgi:hypothetical protein
MPVAAFDTLKRFEQRDQGSLISCRKLQAELCPFTARGFTPYRMELLAEFGLSRISIP